MIQKQNQLHITSMDERGFGQINQPSPLVSLFSQGGFVDDAADRILADISLSSLPKSFHSNADGQVLFNPASYELAGPRRLNFWKSNDLKVAIVTCGGIAPGLNNVIQNVVNLLTQRYRVQNIFGVPYGFFGFSHDSDSKRFQFAWRRLDSFAVQNIDFEGGSILGTSRGHSDVTVIVDALSLRKIDVLFAIGGDGTLRGALSICEEIERRHLPIAVVGIPKTIDNDVLLVSKSFGFETAVAKGVEALRCAQSEARGAYHGIGLVKLMGRNSGALTAMASAAMSDIDFVLIPEVPLYVKGNLGFYQALMQRLLERGNVTVAVAEGAGQHLFENHKGFDKSGNSSLADIGLFLKQGILEEFQNKNVEISLKYIDPSYMLRAQPTSADDSVFCQNLAHNAVHAAMAGKTRLIIGFEHQRFTHVPLDVVCAGKKPFNILSQTWQSVLATTGQPAQWS